MGIEIIVVAQVNLLPYPKFQSLMFFLLIEILKLFHPEEFQL